MTPRPLAERRLRERVGRRLRRARRVHGMSLEALAAELERVVGTVGEARLQMERALRAECAELARGLVAFADLHTLAAKPIEAANAVALARRTLHGR